MKKILAFVLAAVMLLALTACGNTGKDNETNAGDTTTQAPTEAPTEAAPAGPAVIEPSVNKDTLGYLYYEKLVEVKTANPAATAEEIVNAIMESKLSTAAMGTMVMPVEPDTFLQGIGTDGATFGGFTAGAVIAPMMMGSPFIVYVFDLAEDADVAAFVSNLEKTANPAWNVCTIAETTTVGACGNSVVLAMCQAKIPSSVSGIAEVVEPTNLVAGSDAEAIWNTFKTVMAEQTNPMIVAEEVANAMVAAGVQGEAAGVMEIIKNPAFVYEIDTYNGATITNGDKIVYIFALDLGMDVENWTSYYCTAAEGADVVFGSYNETIVAMVNLS